MPFKRLRLPAFLHSFSPANLLSCTPAFLLSCIPILLLFCFLFSCGPSMQVTYDYDDTVDFTTYKTFRFGNINMDPKQVSEFNRKRIINAIGDEMESKGFIHDTTNADMQIHVFAKTKQVKQQTGTTTTAVRYGGPYWYGGYPTYYRSGWGVTAVSTQPVYSEYTDGTLLIDIVDVKKDQLIWQGIGQEHVTYFPSEPEEIKAEIAARVRQIMASFPPQ